ncbi:MULTISPECIES: GntR family transcriptional regulator [unclassified Hyphomicrobium]|uniref:GntR family transcriptional regulator n=1 Tax=unclassified Hyphomicrobium TaxID=2619925 RepID=UPI000213F894|nr:MULTISPECIES: GntR family transcriptional regulator [unclassified Hyphomicrobium]CCB63491.1 Transcriptional regulator [Hyphomicrobium sp. MC1]
MSDVEADSLQLVQSPTLVRQLAADTIRNAILKGILKPGERLVEATLAKRMGVSRPSLREALTQLAAEKLVTITPNRGPAVAAIGWSEAQNIYELRALIEAEAISNFTSRATVENINAMRRSLQNFQRAIPKKDITQLLESTKEFYATIIRSCGNPVIGEVLAGLNARINFLRARSMSQPGRSRHSLAEMTAILEEIEHGSPHKARQAAVRHVVNAALAAKAAFFGEESKSPRPKPKKALKKT